MMAGFHCLYLNSKCHRNCVKFEQHTDVKDVRISFLMDWTCGSALAKHKETKSASKKMLRLALALVKLVAVLVGILHASGRLPGGASHRVVL